MKFRRYLRFFLAMLFYVPLLPYIFLSVILTVIKELVDYVTEKDIAFQYWFLRQSNHAKFLDWVCPYKEFKGGDRKNRRKEQSQ